METTRTDIRMTVDLCGGNGLSIAFDEGRRAAANGGKPWRVPVVLTSFERLAWANGFRHYTGESQ